ncbi:MAG: glycosyltransferase family 39 protein [Bryobacteraceae bacterium]
MKRFPFNSNGIPSGVRYNRVLADLPPTLSDLPTQGRFSRLSTRLEGIRSRLETARFTSRDSAIVMAGVILLYLAMTAFSAQRHLWHDELFTYYIAKSPSMTQFWQALRLDLNPPLSYLLVRGSLSVLGDNSYAVRFPFIVAFLVGSLCFYSFVSRRLRPAYGLLAMLVFWSTPFFYLSNEARPYGLIIGFFGMAMLAWQRAIEPGRSRVTLLMFALAVTGMMLSHFFTLFYITPFCLAELLRWRRSRRFDLPLWAALVLPLLILCFYLATIRSYQAALFPPSFQASPLKIVRFFYETLSPESLALLLAICAGLSMVFRRQPPRTETKALMTSPEAAFTAGLLLIPVLINLAQMRSHGVTFPRYSAPAVFAYGLLLAFFLAMHTNANRLAASVACCILLAWLAAANIVPPALTVLRASRANSTASVRPPSIQQVRPDLPLVAASGLAFLELDKYSDASTVSRLYYLTGGELAIRYAHATLFEGFPVVKRYFPIRAHIEPYPQFVAEHPQFLVAGTPDYPEDWLLRRLLDIHATLQYLGDFPEGRGELYQVTMPGA